LLLFEKTTDGGPVFSHLSTAVVDFLQRSAYYTSCVEISTAEIDSEIWVVNFRLVAPSCIINLRKIDLTDVFRIKNALLSVPQSMQIHSRV